MIAFAKRVSWAAGLVLLSGQLLFAQRVSVGNENNQLPSILGPNGGLLVECLGGTCAGAGGITSDTDDGSVAAGQVPGLVINLNYLWNGATWQRWTGAVTNAGTFAVQCTSGCSAGTPGQTTMANSSPVVIASDQATFPVSATLSAETTKVIGTVNQGTNPWTVNVISGFATAAAQTDKTQFTKLTDGTRDGTVKAASTLPALTDTALVTTQRDPLPAGTNVIGHTIIDTTSTTAVTQATGTNLHAVIDSGSVTVSDGSGALNVIVDSGTTTVTQGTAANLNAAVVGTGTAGSPAGNILTVQGVASMTKLLVTPDSVALPANQSVNVAQLAGTATSVNSGTKDAGTLRVVLATDQPALTNKLLVTPDSVALPANQSVNVAQIAGTATVTAGVNGLQAVGGNVAADGVDSGNPVKVGCRAISATPTAVSAADRADLVCDLAGNVFQMLPISWTCNLQALAATLTQCQAAPAAGFSLYVTSVIATTTTGTAGTMAIRYGTGSNCATGTTGFWPQPGGASPSRTVTLPLVTAQPFVWTFPSGMKVAAANALCVIGVATNTTDISLSGFTAP